MTLTGRPVVVYIAIVLGLFCWSNGANARANKHSRDSREIVYNFRELCLQQSNLIELSQKAMADRWKPKSTVKQLSSYLDSLNGDNERTRYSVFKKGKYFLAVSETTHLIFQHKIDGSNLVGNSCEIFYLKAAEPLSSEPLFEVLGEPIEISSNKNVLPDGSLEASVQTWRFKSGGRSIGVVAQFVTPKFQASNNKLIHVAGTALRAQYFVKHSVGQNEPLTGPYRFDAVSSLPLKTVER